ncbi:MAG: Crp/Fnr family transcriptional regulator [Umezawaea sp.]
MHILPSSFRLPTNDSLYNWGEQGSLLYVVESGCVKTMTYSAIGKACLLDIYGPGDIIGESCLLCEERTETATAMLPTVLRRVRRDQFLESLANDLLREKFLYYLTNRILQQQQMISLFVMMDSERRLAATLLRLGRKLGVRDGHMLLIPHRLTHEELGGLVGTTRSRVGYFLKRFRDMGMIEPRKPWPLALHERRIAAYAQGLPR